MHAKPLSIRHKAFVVRNWGTNVMTINVFSIILYVHLIVLSTLDKRSILKVRLISKDALAKSWPQYWQQLSMLYSTVKIISIIRAKIIAYMMCIDIS